MLADKVWRQALHDDLHLRNGFDVHNGQITCRAVADALNLPYTPADQVLQM
jgi:alanine dehydrogenase